LLFHCKKKTVARTRLDVTLYDHSVSRLVLPGLSFFQPYSDLFYLLIVGVEGYCCTAWLASMPRQVSNP